MQCGKYELSVGSAGITSGIHGLAMDAMACIGGEVMRRECTNWAPPSQTAGKLQWG